MTIAKADSAIEAALVALRSTGARFRLRDILVEEVSLVDRAANKRRFLVVKQGENMATEQVQKVDLPKPVKAALLRQLTEALERLVSVTNMVRDANETDEQMDSPVPAAMGRELMAIGKLIDAALEKYPSPVARSALALADFVAKTLGEEAPAALSAEKLSDLGSEAADKLKVLARVLAVIADAGSPDELASMANRMLGVGKALKRAGTASKVLEAVAEASSAAADEAKGGDDLTAETVVKIRQLAATLNELVEKYPSPVAGAAKGAGSMNADAATNTNKTDATPSGDGQPTANAEPTKTETTPTETTAKSGDGAEPPKPADPPAPAEKSDDADDDAVTVDESVLKMADAVATGVVEITKRGAKMSKPRLRKLRMAVSTLAELLDEIDGAVLLSSGKEGDAQKRAAESTPQPPTREPGDLSNVGHNGPPDKRADKAENEPAIQDVLKRVDELSADVKKLAETPEPPASRADEHSGSPGTTRKRRAGGPWVW